jgi:hypothetical protein
MYGEWQNGTERAVGPAAMLARLEARGAMSA